MSKETRIVSVSVTVLTEGDGEETLEKLSIPMEDFVYLFSKAQKRSGYWPQSLVKKLKKKYGPTDE